MDMNATNEFGLDMNDLRDQVKHAPRTNRIVTKKGLAVDGGEDDQPQGSDDAGEQDTSAGEEALAQALELMEELRQEELAVRPDIWKFCEDKAEQDVRRKVSQGSLDDFAKLAKTRERLTRKYALEQLVNYGLSEGMTKEDFEVLMLAVLGKEGYDALVAGEPPEREVIDDLRLRTFVITQSGSL